MDMKKCVGALIKAKATNRVLLVCRSSRSYNGQYCLVGGKIKYGESLVNGLCRELNEELGGMPDIIKITRLSEFMTDDKHFAFLSAVIVVENEFVPILNKESHGYVWSDIDYLPKPLHPSIKEILKDKFLIDCIKRF